jgi:Domain of unknown function (DUF6484)
MDDAIEFVPDHAEAGYTVATLCGFDADGCPLVRLSGSPDSVVARSVVPIGPADAGAEVVVVFEKRSSQRPIVLGRLQEPPGETLGRPVVVVDGYRVNICAEKEITLTCGSASLTLTRSGKIVLRGTDILSRSSGSNRMKGGSIQLN